jgi:hypothetical protein
LAALSSRLDVVQGLIEKALDGLPFDVRVFVEVAGDSVALEKALDRSVQVRKCFADGDEHYVLGVVLEPQDPTNPLDSQGDVYDAATIRQAAYKFMEEFRNIGLQHSGLVNDKVKILESWIQRDDTSIGGQSVKEGSWLMAVRVLDQELWEAVKDGRITGFSIGGRGKRTPVTGVDGLQ